MKSERKGTSEGMAPKIIRFALSNLGEWYEDLLKLDALLNNNTLTTMSQANIKQALNLKKDLIDRKIADLASKRGMTSVEMRAELLRQANSNDADADE
jgi:hypothetical protein